MRTSELPRSFLAQAQHTLREVDLPRIEACARRLSEAQIWRRANPESNSVGNLILHLEGNVRQWVISGLGGAPDTRVRDREFLEQGPIPRRALLGRLHRTVHEACGVLRGLTGRELARAYSIQGFRVTGLQAVFHVTEHFSLHTGQIILLTKTMQGKNLGFTRLPGERTRRRGLPAV